MRKDETKRRAKKARIKHGHREGGCSITYNSWRAMKQRVYNPNNASYENYKHVSVCKRWHSFMNFLEDMGPRPSAAHWIDRINPYGDYEPLNTRWALPSEGIQRKDVPNYDF